MSNGRGVEIVTASLGDYYWLKPDCTSTLACRSLSYSAFAYRKGQLLTNQHADGPILRDCARPITDEEFGLIAGVLEATLRAFEEWEP